MNGRFVHLLGVILNGGRSSRMGRDKCQLLRGDGRTFFEHSYFLLHELCEQVVISGLRPSPWPNSVPAETVCVADTLERRGPAVGIAASLQYARASSCEACLVIPIDTPELATRDLRLLAEDYVAHRNMTVAVSDKMEPLIAIYPISLQRDLEALIQSDDRSLHRWISKHPHRTVTLSVLSCRNVNSPGDLHS